MKRKIILSILLM